MKKVIITFVAIFALVSVSMAQPRAIGGRVGYNLEFSYQHAIGEANMVELTAGATNVWSPWAYADVTATFDWIFNINGGWNWYVGPGLGVGFGYGRYWHDYEYIPFRLNVGAQIGFEYQFDIPLNLSLDWRPMINTLGFVRGDGYPIYWSLFSLGFGVRYRF